MKRSLMALTLLLGACNGRGEGDAREQAKRILREEVLCEGWANGASGGGGGWTCVGRRTGREVYCSASKSGRCVLVAPGFQAPFPAFPGQTPEASQ